MTVRTIIAMLAIAAVYCAGRIIFHGQLRSSVFRFVCFLIDLLYFVLPGFMYMKLPCRKKAGRWREQKSAYGGSGTSRPEKPVVPEPRQAKETTMTIPRPYKPPGAGTYRSRPVRGRPKALLPFERQQWPYDRPPSHSLADAPPPRSTSVPERVGPFTNCRAIMRSM